MVVELTEYDISYHSPPAIKSQVLADIVAEYAGPDPEETGLSKWQLYVDGASSAQGAGVGVVLIGPKERTSNMLPSSPFRSPTMQQSMKPFSLASNWLKGWERQKCIYSATPSWR